MTLLESLQKVREIILIDPFWDDTEIKKWLNDGYLSFFKKRGIEELWTNDVVDTETMAVPTDLHKIFDIWYKPTGSTTKSRLEDTTYRIFDNYIEFGSSLTGTVYLEGQKTPPKVTDEVNFLLPEKFQMGIVCYAISVAFLKDEDEKSAASYYNLYLSDVRAWEQMPTFRTTKWKDNWTGNIGG